MEFKENVKLAPYTTFRIGGSARYFCTVLDQFEALQAFEFAKEKTLNTFVLGGGSNLLVSDNGFDGLVMKVENRGIEVLNNNDTSNILLRVAAGEIWDEVVKFAVKNSWWGIENLSHIPGSTGAIAVQNVGAYGQEAKNVIESVTAFDRTTGQIVNINNKECGFSYRSSVFNEAWKGRYIIFFITFKLQKDGKPNLNYRDLRQRFAGSNPSLAEIRQAVTEIRDTKYPFPTEPKKGNAGSFFKNPVLSAVEFAAFEPIIEKNFGSDTLLKLRAVMFHDKGQFKVPAAFLLEICGLKDMELNGVRINHNQPLVMLNASGKASSADVLSLAAFVLKTIKEKTGLALKIEPELVGFSADDLKILNV